MSLSEIKNKLYKKDLKNEAIDKEKWDISIENKSEEKLEEWQAPKEGLSQGSRKILKIAGIISLGIIIVLALVVGILKYREGAFSEEKIILNWEGPSETLSGRDISYKLSWENQNRAKLENVVLKIKFPENFILTNTDQINLKENNEAFWNLGTIDGKSKGELDVVGKIYSPKGAFVYLNASLDYHPSNFSSRFIVQKQLGIKSMSAPLDIEVSAPQGVGTGGVMRYEIYYKNTQETSFSDLKIKANYPEGFSFGNSDITSIEEGKIWVLGDLISGQEGKIIVEGKIEGNRDEVKKASFMIGTYERGVFTSFNDAEVATKIISSPLSIFQKMDKQDTIFPKINKTIDFEIFFKNESNVGLRDVVVTEHLEGEALDFSTLKLNNGGDYDSASHTITWRAAEYSILSNLNPNQEGSIKFSIATKSELPINSSEDRNFVIKSLAKIDSPDVPTPIDMNKIIASNLTILKVSSPVVLETLGYYEDSIIENYGPLPPKVNQETTLAIHWKIYSPSNSLSNAQVEAYLPSGVTFTGNFSPNSENINYNSRTNKIIWKIETIEAGTGKLNSPKEIVFQIKVKPSIEQKGEVVDILKEPSLTAVDDFTKENVALTNKSKTFELREDSKITSAGYKVVE